MSKNKDKSQKLSPVKGSKGCVTCNVVLLDGETLEVPIQKNDNGRALFDRVCEHLDLVEKDFFGFTYTDDKGPSHLKYWLNLDKPISKVKKQDGAWVFDFALKFYPPDPAQLRESLTRYLVVLQIRRDLLSGRIPCTLTTYALLGSYNVQADVGEYDQNDHGHSDYIKNMTFAPNQTPELLERITELHKQHKGQTPDEAERAFLDNAKKLAMYGIDLHKARDADTNSVMLGVCCSGLLIYREKLRISRFVWPKILKLSYKRNYFNIKIRPGELERGEATIAFKLDTHKLAKRLWKTCVEHHAFFRLRESETPTNNPTFPRFGSKFRYSGRTLYQSRNATALLDRPPPFFERSQPNRNSYEDSGNRSQSMDELGRSKRLMSVDSRDSSLYGGDTLNRTREYNLDDPSKNDVDDMGNTIQRRAPNPYDSLDRRDRVPGRGDATENYDGGKDFMALNGDKPMCCGNIDDPCKYRYNKDGQEYPLGYPCDVAGKEYAFDKDGNKYMVNGGRVPANGVLYGPEDPKRYRFDKYGREFPFAFPCDVNGKDYAYDKNGNGYPNGKDGLRYRFDRDGNEYPHGYPYDREGREYSQDRDGNVYPYGVGSEKFGYDTDGKKYRYDNAGYEYLQGFPFDKNGKEYPYDQDGNRFPYGGDGQGYVFDSQGREFPRAFPYDKEGIAYPYDKDGNKCPTEGFRFDREGNEYPLAYPCDNEGKKYCYDKDGNKYPQGQDGRDQPGYVYGKDGNEFRFDKDGKEFPGAFPCDPQGKEYPYNKDGVRCPCSLATSSPVAAYRYDQAGNEYPLAYPCDSSGKEYAYDKDGHKYPKGADGADRTGYVYGKDGNAYRFDKKGNEFPGTFPCDQQGKEYPYNKEGVRCPSSLATSSPVAAYRFDQAGNEYPLAYPYDSAGKEYAYDKDGNKCPKGSGYVYGKDGDMYKFDKKGREFPGAFPCDKQGKEYAYNKAGERCPSCPAAVYRFDNDGCEYPLAYPYDSQGKEYPYDKDGHRFPQGKDGRDQEGYVYGRDGDDFRFDKNGQEFPSAYPCDQQGKEYPYSKDGIRCPLGMAYKDVLKFPAGVIAPSYDVDGQKYRYDPLGSEFPFGYPYDKEGNDYPYDQEGNRCPFEGYRFDSLGREYPLGYPIDKNGNVYCYDRDGNRFPQTKDGVDRTGYVYDRDGKRYRFNKDGTEYPYGFPFDRAGKEYCYDKDGKKYHDPAQDQVQQNGYYGDTPDRHSEKKGKQSKKTLEAPDPASLSVESSPSSSLIAKEETTPVMSGDQGQVQPSSLTEIAEEIPLENDEPVLGNYCNLSEPTPLPILEEKPEEESLVASEMEYVNGDATTTLPYGTGLGMGVNDMTGVVGVEQDLEHSEWFEPLPQTIKETKDSLKSTMPFFSPAATSTVGRSKGPPPPIPSKPRQSVTEDSFNTKTERDGVEVAHVVQKVTITGDGDEDDFDFDAALADAIRSVTEFNPDMSVERIECVQQIEDVKDGN